MSVSRKSAVVSDLQRHVLIDGFRIVIDFKKSHGSKLVDAVTGRELIDLYGFYGSLPVGFNHPHFDRPAYRRRNIVERVVGWLKDSRRLATRFEKLAVNFLAMVQLAMLQRCLRVLYSSDRA